MNKAKYLRITMHDNDFCCSLEFVGELLQQIFMFEVEYPTEKDFPTMKEMIKHIWYGVDNIQGMLRWNERHWQNGLNVFDPHLEFVNFKDIPDWDNSESIYIPMFDGQIIIR